MRYKITGGADGVSGIEVAGQRYEPGSTVELPPSKAGWLIDGGYLEPADGKAKAIEPEPEPEPSEAPTEASPVSEEATSTEGTN